MIVLAFITIVLFTIKSMFLILPDVPGLPEEVVDAADYVIGMIADVAGFVAYIFTPGLLTFILVSSIVLFNFDTLYKATMWTLGKIPWINIH